MLPFGTTSRPRSRRTKPHSASGDVSRRKPYPTDAELLCERTDEQAETKAVDEQRLLLVMTRKFLQRLLTGPLPLTPVEQLGRWHAVLTLQLGCSPGCRGAMSVAFGAFACT